MALPENFLETVITAVVSSGGTAVSAILAFFRDVKKRVDDLERRVGSSETRSGLVQSVSELEQAVEKIQEWASHPPEWLVQLVSRGRRSAPSYVSPDNYDEIDNRFRALERKLKTFEAELAQFERRLDRTVTDDTFDAADRQRAKEISEIRASIAGISGTLKGLESAWGLLGKTPHR